MWDSLGEEVFQARVTWKSFCKEWPTTIFPSITLAAISRASAKKMLRAVCDIMGT